MSDTPQLQSVLLIDDDDFIQDIYSTKFTEAGVDVNTAGDGDEALEMLRKSDYDAVLIDIIMPGTDGLELLEKMEEEGLGKESSIIILSNQGQPEDVDKAEKFDIDGYIIKASNVPSEVLEKVTTIYHDTHA